MNGSARPSRIVILGGGFAGISVARRLEGRLRPEEAEIVLVSRENFSLFTPMLPEVSSGELEVRDVVTPIRSQLRRTRFILGDVRSVDIEGSLIDVQHTLTGAKETLEYDHVIVALGATTSTFNLPGVAERVFALKTLEDAGILRNRLVWLLELADSLDDNDERERLLTIVVVGGGFTGVEATGELVELFRSVVRFYPRVTLKDVRVVLVEGGPTLLPGLPAKMGQYSENYLRKRGVEIVTGDNVASADDRALTLASGARIETRTIVWSAGVKPSPTLASTPLPRTKNGAISVNEDFRVPGFPGVWALGDCAAIPSGDGGTFPPTAQHAIREGPALADNLVAVLRGKPTKAFRFTSLGMMASLGGRKAVAQLPGDRVLTGFLAWFLWRSYYLLRLPTLDRKLRVAFDWTLELLFPRDIAELRVYTRNAHSSAAVDAGLVPRDEPLTHL
jgi:NADH dehydrogenase